MRTLNIKNLKKLKDLKFLKRYKKPFWYTLFYHQNKYHRHGVLVHTLKVVYHLIRMKNYRMIPAGLLHDIAKPLAAFQDEEDLRENIGGYSFNNHEKFSWYLIRNWPINNYTKDLVRYHYHIRALGKTKTDPKKHKKYNRLKREYDRLDPGFKEDLKKFMICDDLGKK